MFSAASPGHILVVLVVALLVLGPSELPKVLRAISQMRRQLRTVQAHLNREIQDAFESDAAPGPTKVTSTVPNSEPKDERSLGEGQDTAVR
jgi:Sec-independent protein translocase protein TatA